MNDLELSLPSSEDLRNDPDYQNWIAMSDAENIATQEPSLFERLLEAAEINARAEANSVLPLTRHQPVDVVAFSTYADPAWRSFERRKVFTVGVALSFAEEDRIRMVWIATYWSEAKEITAPPVMAVAS